ncbi:hypothetical protein CERSUDRAFT_78206 [Gelatoporia subvermispora B]|uniref:Uncharacterized protein n=1 Tax=Ceriporiopsis subvermispora (strain B) TaxID=914234 RepID=M2P7Y6_CERS8|nr:hypothetical protein CERSUDRAFT_78206 [Gelatoporia subvermispora B]
MHQIEPMLKNDVAAGFSTGPADIGSRRVTDWLLTNSKSLRSPKLMITDSLLQETKILWNTRAVPRVRDTVTLSPLRAIERAKVIRVAPLWSPLNANHPQSQRIECSQGLSPLNVYKVSGLGKRMARCPHANEGCKYTYRCGEQSVEHKLGSHISNFHRPTTKVWYDGCLTVVRRDTTSQKMTCPCGRYSSQSAASIRDHADRAHKQPSAEPSSRSHHELPARSFDRGADSTPPPLPVSDFALSPLDRRSGRRELQNQMTAVKAIVLSECRSQVVDSARRSAGLKENVPPPKPSKTSKKRGAFSTHQVDEDTSTLDMRHPAAKKQKLLAGVRNTDQRTSRASAWTSRSINNDGSTMTVRAATSHPGASSKKPLPSPTTQASSAATRKTIASKGPSVQVQTKPRLLAAKKPEPLRNRTASNCVDRESEDEAAESEVPSVVWDSDPINREPATSYPTEDLQYPTGSDDAASPFFQIGSDTPEDEGLRNSSRSPSPVPTRKRPRDDVGTFDGEDSGADFDRAIRLVFMQNRGSSKRARNTLAPPQGIKSRSSKPKNEGQKGDCFVPSSALIAARTSEDEMMQDSDAPAPAPPALTLHRCMGCRVPLTAFCKFKRCSDCRAKEREKRKAAQKRKCHREFPEFMKQWRASSNARVRDAAGPSDGGAQVFGKRRMHLQNIADLVPPSSMLRDGTEHQTREAFKQELTAMLAKFEDKRKPIEFHGGFTEVVRRTHINLDAAEQLANEVGVKFGKMVHTSHRGTNIMIGYYPCSCGVKPRISSKSKESGAVSRCGGVVELYCEQLVESDIVRIWGNTLGNIRDHLSKALSPNDNVAFSD